MRKLIGVLLLCFLLVGCSNKDKANEEPEQCQPGNEMVEEFECPTYDEDIEKGNKTTEETNQDNKTTEETNQGNGTTYTVQKGDTLKGIAMKLGLTVEQLQNWNSIHDSDKIFVGQVLSLVETKTEPEQIDKIGIDIQVKDYILYGQGDKPYVAQLKWNETFLKKLSSSDIEKVYQEFLENGGTLDDIEGFAEYLTNHAPVLDGWEELAEIAIRENYDVEIIRFESFGELIYSNGQVFDELYQVYVEIDGVEVPFVTFNARTGNYHG